MIGTMRVLLAELAHESNAFAGTITSVERFAELDLARGPAALAAHRARTTVVSGFIRVLEAEGAVVEVAVTASAFPSGPVEAAFFTGICHEIEAAARERGPWDGVLLSLHGAMAVEAASGIDDPEGLLVAAVRDAVGPAVPIGVVLDLHSDTTDLLLASADFTLAYNEEPHRDLHERGREAAALLLRVAGGLRPARARERVPMLLPAINMATDSGPMEALHRLREAAEGRPGVIDVSLHAGFYGSDQPEAGFSVVCTTEGDEALARTVARELARAAWLRREEFLVPLSSPGEAVAMALAAGEPVGLVDEADDPAGGASGDSTVILAAMIAGGIERGGVSTITDAEVARAGGARGVGATLRVALGGKSDGLHGPPLEVEGVVRLVRDGPLPIDRWSGKTYDPGATLVLDVRGIMVVVTERKMISENIDILGLLGFDVTEMQAIMLKGLGLHIRQAHVGRIPRFLAVDGMGVTHPDVRKLGPYRHVRRPVWPLDPETTYG